MKSSVIGNSLQTFPNISRPARRSLPGCRSFLPLHSAKTLPSFKPIAAQTSADLSGFFNCKSHSSMAEPVNAKGKGKLQVFESKDDLSDSMAKYIAGLSEKFIRERGAFTLVLSGGSLFKYLGKLYESPYFDSIGWENWHVFWVDERVVPKDHPDSNYKLAYDALLSKVPIPPGHVYAINDSLSAEGAAHDYETCLKHLVKTNVVSSSTANGFPKFDLILLGMGPDGHVASLFPGHSLVNENQRWVTFITDSPKPPPERITFTFPVINSAANIAVVVTGAGKAEALSRVFVEKQDSGLLPIQMVSAEEGELAWFLDKGAASLFQDNPSPCI